MSQSFRVATFAAITALSVFWVAGCGNDIKIPPVTLGGNGATGGTGTGAGATGGTSGSGAVVDLTCPDVPLDASGMPTASATAGACNTAMRMACVDAPTQQFDPSTMPGYHVGADATSHAKSKLSTLEELDEIAQMEGVGYDPNNLKYNDIERSPDLPAKDVLGYRYRDAGRGVNLSAGQDNRTSDGSDYSTVFPAESARAASWDVDLERRVGEAMGDEVVASKNNMLLAPCMNIIRHPYWGRTQETYSEDMYHTGRMASALTAGIQTYIVSCAKHFAANNIERLRKDQNAIMDDQTLREIYGRHFQMVAQDGGVGCIMASYNQINGVKSTQNAHLLTDILRNDFGYKGLVISDWWAMPGDQQAVKNTPDANIPIAAQAVNAGLDIEVPWTIYFSALPQALTSNLLQRTAIDQAAEHILTQKFRFGSASISAGVWGLKPATSVLTGASIDNKVHQALAEETEMKSAVLLANGTNGAAPVLPLAAKPTVAVIGLQIPFTLKSGSCPSGGTVKGLDCTLNLATDANLGDRGSSRVNGDPLVAISPLKGIQAIGPSHGTMNITTGPDVTTAAAASADSIVVVVGLTAGDEGEEYAIKLGGDRTSLDLPDDQATLVASALALNKPTVIIVESGSIVNLPWLDDPNHNQATIWAGYPGLLGGSALAKLIFADGGANFSGKMPMAWPLQADLQKFTDTSDPDPSKNTTTKMGYFFGYRYYDFLASQNMPKSLVFPFGQGLSYTTFKYSNLAVGCSQATASSIVNVSVDIQNTGAVPGDETAMLFVKPPTPPSDVVGAARPVKELKSFKKVYGVPVGQGVRTTMQLRIQDLRRWQADAPADTSTTGKWVIDSGDYTIMVGKNAADADMSNPMVLSQTLTVVGN